MVFGVFCREVLAERLLKISQQSFAEQLADKYGIEFGKSLPLPVETKLAEFDKNEALKN